MSRDTFDNARRQNNPEFRFARNDTRGWFVISGRDPRGYVVMLQQTTNEKEPMVRAGCKYKTLKAARNWDNRSRRTAAQMLALIGIAVATAQRNGWLSRKIKFNTTPRKVTK